MNETWLLCWCCCFFCFFLVALLVLLRKRFTIECHLIHSTGNASDLIGLHWSQQSVWIHTGTGNGNGKNMDLTKSWIHMSVLLLLKNLDEMKSQVLHCYKQELGMPASPFARQRARSSLDWYETPCPTCETLLMMMRMMRRRMTGMRPVVPLVKHCNHTYSLLRIDSRSSFLCCASYLTVWLWNIKQGA